MNEDEKSDDNGDEREKTELLFLKAVILPSYHPFVNNVHIAHNTTKTESMKWKATKYYAWKVNLLVVTLFLKYSTRPTCQCLVFCLLYAGNMISQHIAQKYVSNVYTFFTFMTFPIVNLLSACRWLV